MEDWKDTYNDPAWSAELDPWGIDGDAMVLPFTNATFDADTKLNPLPDEDVGQREPYREHNATADDESMKITMARMFEKFSTALRSQKVVLLGQDNIIRAMETRISMMEARLGQPEPAAVKRQDEQEQRLSNLETQFQKCKVTLARMCTALQRSSAALNRSAKGPTQVAIPSPLPSERDPPGSGRRLILGPIIRGEPHLWTISQRLVQKCNSGDLTYQRVGHASTSVHTVVLENTTHGVRV